MNEIIYRWCGISRRGKRSTLGTGKATNKVASKKILIQHDSRSPLIQLKTMEFPIKSSWNTKRSLICNKLGQVNIFYCPKNCLKRQPSGSQDNINFSTHLKLILLSDTNRNVIDFKLLSWLSFHPLQPSPDLSSLWSNIKRLSPKKMNSYSPKIVDILNFSKNSFK